MNEVHPSVQRPSPWAVAAAAVAAVLVAIAAAAGVFLRGDLATQPFMTVRGDTVDILTGGVYRFNGVNIASEGVGWDIVTLFVAVPALLLALPGLRRGSLRSTLLGVGVLAYFLYQYLEYATFLAYGPLFLVYVGAFSLSLVAIVLIVASLDIAGLPARFDARFPRRGVAGLGVFMVILLAGMWLPLVLKTTTQSTVSDLYGGTTLVVQAFDLGFLVPLGIFTAIAAYRRLAVGYLLAGVVTVKAATMALAIAAMLVVEWAATGTNALPPIVVFGAVAAVSAAIGWRVYASVRPATPAKTPPVRRAGAEGSAS